MDTNINEIEISKKVQNGSKNIKKTSKKVKKMSSQSKYFDFYDDVKSGCHKVIDW